VKRIIVVGPPGSGKTTVGRELSERTGIPHTEIDSLWWEPNWTEAGADVLKQRLQPFVDRAEWILDGNYFSVVARDVVWPRADTIVWLDLPRLVTVPRVLRRTVARVVTRQDLWGTGNRESISVLRPDSIVRFAWTAHPKYNLRYLGLWDDPDLAHLTWVRLRSGREIRRWLSASLQREV
jgi:adenylate kinase family enzyme